MATFAETMLSKYETLLATSAGLDTVSVDGQPVTATGRAVVESVRYIDVEAKYRYWKREVAREASQRPQAASTWVGSDDRLNGGRPFLAQSSLCVLSVLGG